MSALNPYWKGRAPKECRNPCLIWIIMVVFGVINYSEFERINERSSQEIHQIMY